MALILKIVGAGIGGVVVLAGVVAVLVLTGSPQACTNRQISESPEARLDLQNKWDDFKLRASAGAAEVTFNETEVTSRGIEYVNREGFPLEDLQVFFCSQGDAEATAIWVGGGPALDLLARGTLDISGDASKLNIQSVQVGNFPVAMGEPPFLDEEAKTLDLGVRLTSVTFSDQRVTLTGAP